MSIIEETLHRLGEQQASQTDAQIIAARAIPASSRHPIRMIPRMLLIGGGVIIAFSAVAWFLPELLGRNAAERQLIATPVEKEQKTSLQATRGPGVVDPAPASTGGNPKSSIDESNTVETSVIQADQSGRGDVGKIESVAELSSGRVTNVVQGSSATSMASVAKVSARDGVPQDHLVWLEDGRLAMHKGESDKALKLWEDGLNSLGARQMVVALAAYRDFSPAVVAWRKLAAYPDAIIVAGSYGKLPAWRVVLLSSPENRQREQDLRQAREVLGVTGGAITTVARLGRISPEIKSAPQPSFDPLGQGLLPEPKVPAESHDFVFEGQADPAVQAMNRGDFRESVAQLRVLVEHYPKRSEPLLWLAKSELALGNSADAERRLAQLTELNPSLGEAWMLRGIVAQERGEHALAIRWLGEAARLQPNAPDIHFNIGYSYDALGKRGEAEVAWRKFFDLARDKARYAKQRDYVEQRLVNSAGR